MEPARLLAANLAESRECIEPPREAAEPADDAELTSLKVGDTERETEPAGRRPADSRARSPDRQTHTADQKPQHTHTHATGPTGRS